MPTERMTLDPICYLRPRDFCSLLAELQDGALHLPQVVEVTSGLRYRIAARFLSSFCFHHLHISAEAHDG